MNPVLGWVLAALFAIASGQAYGWQGLALAATVVVFWLLMQFNRTIRVMRNAAGRPVGHVPSVVMLHAKLKCGMTLMQVVTLTRSLGSKLDAADDGWAWVDPGGSRVELHFERGRLARWQLDRTAESELG